MSAKKKDKEIKENQVNQSDKTEAKQEKVAVGSVPASPGAADQPKAPKKPTPPAPPPAAEKETAQAKIPAKKKIIKEGDLTLSGYFKAICSATPPNVPLIDVPLNYKVVNVASAVLDQRALVDFDGCTRNINIPMIEKVREEKKVKVLLSVGGPNGNFQFLNSSGSVDTFYNSLFSHIYQSWGFDGVTFDIQQLNEANRSYVTAGIRKFKEFSTRNEVEALISITARPTFVCPDADGIAGIWNQLVPVINELKKDNIIDLIQIMAYNYGSDYDPLKEKDVPVGKPKEMLEYIFNSYAKPCEIQMGSETIKYEGFDPDKLMLGVLASADTGLKDFVPAGQVNEAIQELNQEHPAGIGGAMVFNINYDANNNYAFSKTLVSGKE